MLNAVYSFKGYALLVISFLLFIAVLIIGLFHIEERGVIYFALLGGALALFSFSLFSYLLGVYTYLKEEYSKRKNLWSFIFDFFADLRLAIFIMIVLGILSMVGSTYVQQNQPIACSFKRLPRIWIQTFTKERFQKLDEHMEKHLKPISIHINPSEEKIAKFLQRMGFKVFMEKEGERTYFYAEKGKFSRLGVYVVHIGLLVIMAGALIDALWGIRGTVIVPEGSKRDTLIIPAKEKAIKLPFQIELEDFRIVSYEEEFKRKGKVKETPFKDAIASFESDIRIIQDGKVVARGTTAVNSPFDFGSYRIFQATYGLTGEAGKAKIAIFDKNLAPKDPQKAFLGDVELKAGKVSEFKNMLLSIDRSTLNLEDEQKGFQGELKPAMVVKVLMDGKSYDVPVVYSPELTIFAQSQLAQLKDFPYIFFLVDFEPQYFSGLQVSRQAGTPIIWLGSILVVGGMLIAFYTVHRKVWVRLEGNTLKVAFWSHKFKEEFKKSFLNSLEVLKHENTSHGKEPNTS